MQIEHLTHQYNSQTIFESINLSLNAGKYRLKGPNASGKSTFLRLLAGLEQPTAGCIDTKGESTVIASDSIIYPSMLTILQMTQLYIRHQSCSTNNIRQKLEEWGLTKYCNNPIDSLSTGSLQKLRLIIAFSTSVNWLLLDEPFNGLDQNTLQLVAEHITLTKQSVILVDHANTLPLPDFKDINWHQGQWTLTS